MHSENVNIHLFEGNSLAGTPGSQGNLGLFLDGPPYPQTVQSAKQWFKDRGIKPEVWARVRGLKVHTIKQMFSGRLTGERKQTLREAVALGLRPSADLVDMPVNAQLLNGIEIAKRTIIDLDALGIEAAGLVQVFPPILSVKTCPATAQLNAQPGPITDVDGVLVRPYTAQFGECLVRWIEAI